MKAWIAFNAWYESGEISGRTDKAKIDEISTHNNRFRDRMNNLLESEDTEGKAYKENVANLHAALVKATITSQEYFGYKQTISFSEVAVKNVKDKEILKIYNYQYLCKKEHEKLITIVTDLKTNTEVFHREQSEYNVADIKSQTDFNVLSDKKKSNCIKCYEALRPYNTESVIDSKSKRKMGMYGFVDDPDRISNAIIRILYMLRCCLAHGDIMPDEASNNVYHYAYEVLIPPLKKLI